jgi:hypothetical protein
VRRGQETLLELHPGDALPLLCQIVRKERALVQLERAFQRLGLVFIRREAIQPLLELRDVDPDSLCRPQANNAAPDFDQTRVLPAWIQGGSQQVDKMVEALVNTLGLVVRPQQRSNPL